MANDAAAPLQPAGTPSEDEYQTFCAALSASARGRAFLAEYTRRHRGADTETLLAALARLETLVRARPGADSAQPELRKLLASIRLARPELEQSALPARAAKLAVLLDLLERRLEALADAPPGGGPAVEAGRLAAVPPPEEPELPIPTPAAARPALSVAHERALPPLPAGIVAEPAGSAAIIPEVNWFGDTTPVAAAAEIASAAPSLPVVEPPTPPAIVESAEASPPRAPETAAPVPRENKIVEPKPDPLAVLMALSEEERIALFT